MRLFKRTKQPTSATVKKVTPSVAKDYYQSAQPQRMWLVWLLSVGTFIITVVIVLGIFWAGRWVVHQLTKPKTPAPTTVQQTTANNRQNADTRGQSPPAKTNDSTTKTSTTATPAATPTPANSSTDLVKTGPDSDIW
jgi:cytoskeletal protein RodZ